MHALRVSTRHTKAKGLSLVMFEVANHGECRLNLVWPIRIDFKASRISDLHTSSILLRTCSLELHSHRRDEVSRGKQTGSRPTFGRLQKFPTITELMLGRVGRFFGVSEWNDGMKGENPEIELRNPVSVCRWEDCAMLGSIMGGWVGSGDSYHHLTSTVGYFI